MLLVLPITPKTFKSLKGWPQMHLFNPWTYSRVSNKYTAHLVVFEQISYYAYMLSLYTKFTY